MRRRALLAASGASGGKIDNFVSIVERGSKYTMIFEYPCDVPLKVMLENYDQRIMSIPAGTSSYNMGISMVVPYILSIEPQSDSIYNYTW